MPKVSFSVLPQTTSYDNYFYSFGYKSLWETLLVCETFSLCLMVNPKEPKNQNSDLVNFSVFLEIRQLTLSQSVSMPHFYGGTFWIPCAPVNIFVLGKKRIYILTLGWRRFSTPSDDHGGVQQIPLDNSMQEHHRDENRPPKWGADFCSITQLKNKFEDSWCFA